MGVFGAGLASSVAATLALVVLWLAVAKVPAPDDPTLRRLDVPLLRRILALGIPVGLQLLVEVTAFAAASALSGRIGQVAAAGNQVALTLASMTFMVPLGWVRPSGASTRRAHAAPASPASPRRRRS